MRVRISARISGFMLLCSAFSIDAAETATDVKVDTYVYSVKGNDELKLDVYNDTTVMPQGKKPVMIYLFGGGWEYGTRTDGKEFVSFWAQQGFTSVAIDYRLGIKLFKEQHNITDLDTSGYYADAHQYAIKLAVTDLYDATSYLVSNAEALNIDTTAMMISGGSAGATTCNMAEWMICNSDELAVKHLPDGFNYGGVISMAGAGIRPSNMEEQALSCDVFPGFSLPTLPYCHSNQSQA